MSYTGEVTPSGPADVRELDALTITKVSVGPYDNNCYVLTCSSTGETVLVDAANEPERLVEVLGGRRLSLVVTTHQHPDHVLGLEKTVELTGARTAAHPLDAPALPVVPDLLVEDGDEMRVGDVTLRAIHLAGHTPGGLALLYDGEGGHLFTGDSLFPGGVGNTNGDAERFTQLLGDVEAKLFALPDSTWVYPGHGRDTTIGAERGSLDEWRSRGW